MRVAVTRCIAVGLLTFLNLCVFTCGDTPAQVAADKVSTDKATQERVKELLGIIRQPEATSTKLQERIKALEELQKLGESAAPQLIDAAIGESYGHAYDAQQLLMRIGKPTLPAIHARWNSLNNVNRWKLMPIREKFEIDAVRVFARDCLDGGEGVSEPAWQFVLRTKDIQVKDRYYKILRGEDATKPATVRWNILPGKEPIFDKDDEARILISLLKPDSWVARGKDRSGGFWVDLLPPWWPDGRNEIVQIIRDRKLFSAAPALLAVLKEKGAGGGYFADEIVPTLAEFRYKEAIPELELLARKPANPKEDVPYSWLERGEIQTLAIEALPGVLLSLNSRVSQPLG